MNQEQRAFLPLGWPKLIWVKGGCPGCATMSGVSPLTHWMKHLAECCLPLQLAIVRPVEPIVTPELFGYPWLWETEPSSRGGKPCSSYCSCLMNPPNSVNSAPCGKHGADSSFNSSCPVADVMPLLCREVFIMRLGPPWREKHTSLQIHIHVLAWLVPLFPMPVSIGFSILHPAPACGVVQAMCLLGTIWLGAAQLLLRPARRPHMMFYRKC